MQLVFYILYGNVQVAMAFLISCFFSKARTANITTWIWILGAGVFAAQLMENIFAEGRWFSVLLQIIPTFGVYRCALVPLLLSPDTHALTRHVTCCIGTMPCSSPRPCAQVPGLSPCGRLLSQRRRSHMDVFVASARACLINRSWDPRRHATASSVPCPHWHTCLC